MSLPLIFGVIWVLAATGVALLPMKYQYAPGLTLLIAAPVLLIWIGFAHGWLITAFAVFGFVSMFRHPLRAIIKMLLGYPVERPK